jgi:3-oxoacyl-[acyl-carrier protein] reductase
LFLTDKSEERVAELAKITPLERLGTPADIAGVVSFLVSPGGGWMIGQVLRANGGMV